MTKKYFVPRLLKSTPTSILNYFLALVYLISFWLVWAIIKCSGCCSAQAAHTPVYKPRQQELRVYCPHVHIHILFLSDWSQLHQLMHQERIEQTDQWESKAPFKGHKSSSINSIANLTFSFQICTYT